MDNATKALQVLALLLCVGFPIQYAIRVRAWRQSQEGWYLMLSHIGFSMILALGVATAFLGQTWAGRPVIRLLTYIILCCVFLMPTRLLMIRVRDGNREARHRRTSEGDPDE